MYIRLGKEFPPPAQVVCLPISSLLARSPLRPALWVFCHDGNQLISVVVVASFVATSHKWLMKNRLGPVRERNWIVIIVCSFRRLLCRSLWWASDCCTAGQGPEGVCGAPLSAGMHSASQHSPRERRRAHWPRWVFLAKKTFVICWGGFQLIH